jgi:hypothetical protein
MSLEVPVIMYPQYRAADSLDTVTCTCWKAPLRHQYTLMEREGANVREGVTEHFR